MKYARKLPEGKTEEEKTLEGITSDAGDLQKQQLESEYQSKINAIISGYTSGQQLAGASPEMAASYGGGGYTPLTGNADPTYTYEYTGSTFPVAAKEFNYVDSWGSPRSGGRYHRGTDIMAAKGAPAIAVRDGVITQSGNDGGKGGNRVWIKDSSGNEYYYAHLDTIALPAGAKVKAGQVVGTVGDSGNAKGTSPHLHFQFHPGGGNAVNPFPSLKQWENQKVEPLEAGNFNSPYDNLISKIAKANNVPAGILGGLIKRESSFNPASNAFGDGENHMGLTQISETEWKTYNKDLIEKGYDPFHPRANITAGARTLARNYSAYGNWEDSLAAFRAGPGNVATWRQHPVFSKYVGDVMQYQNFMGSYRPPIPFKQQVSKTINQLHPQPFKQQVSQTIGELHPIKKKPPKTNFYAIHG